LRSEKEKREFQLQMLRVQLSHREKITLLSALMTSEITLIIFYISLYWVGKQLISQLDISGETELTAQIIILLTNYLNLPAWLMFIAFVFTAIFYFRFRKIRNKQIEDIRKRFIE